MHPFLQKNHFWKKSIYEGFDAKPSICNPMSVSGRNYRSVLNHHGVTNMDRSMLEWNDRCIQLSSTIAMLKELIGVRDGHGECVGFTFDEIGSFILDICIN